MSCECGHSNSDHEMLVFASGRQVLVCNALGGGRRPIEPGSTTMCRYRNCKCKKVQRVYIVRAINKITKEEYWLGEYRTKEEAERKKDELDEACDDMWCEKHRHWIEEY